MCMKFTVPYLDPSPTARLVVLLHSSVLLSARCVLRLHFKFACRFELVVFLQNFTEALEAYGEAIELDNTNMSFLSNRAAVFFEQKEYEACIAEVGHGDGFRKAVVGIAVHIRGQAPMSVVVLLSRMPV